VVCNIGVGMEAHNACAVETGDKIEITYETESGHTRNVAGEVGTIRPGEYVAVQATDAVVFVKGSRLTEFGDETLGTITDISEFEYEQRETGWRAY